VLAALGGLELAAMAGLMLGGAACRLPVVVDGFPSGAAALVASRLRPSVRDYLLLSHRSAERGHQALCAALGGETPLFDLGLRLGEGTGAVLGAHLVRAAVRVQCEMATFATAGIVGRSGL
jgi:nicotinate-nucleotide--dimethylbenzimidazole phosphoribosyltransferase